MRACPGDRIVEGLDVQPGQVCLSIASSGENSLSLLTRSPSRVVAVDLNPAQLATLELRVAAFRVLEHGELLDRRRVARILWAHRDERTVEKLDAFILEGAQRDAHAALYVQAGIAVPLVKDGTLVAVLTVHFAAPHQWSDVEISLVEETAERTWAAVERARSERALRQREH